MPAEPHRSMSSSKTRARQWRHEVIPNAGRPLRASLNTTLHFRNTPLSTTLWLSKQRWICHLAVLSRPVSLACLQKTLLHICYLSEQFTTVTVHELYEI